MLQHKNTATKLVSAVFAAFMVLAINGSLLVHFDGLAQASSATEISLSTVIVYAHQA